MTDGEQKQAASPYRCETCNKNDTENCNNYQRLVILGTQDGYYDSMKSIAPTANRLGLACHSALQQVPAQNKRGCPGKWPWACTKCPDYLKRNCGEQQVPEPAPELSFVITEKQIRDVLILEEEGMRRVLDDVYDRPLQNRDAAIAAAAINAVLNQLDSVLKDELQRGHCGLTTYPMTLERIENTINSLKQTAVSSDSINAENWSHEEVMNRIQCAYDRGFAAAIRQERERIRDAILSAFSERTFIDSDQDIHECPGLNKDEILAIIDNEARS